jgi:hypothetical protein
MEFPAVNDPDRMQQTSAAMFRPPLNDEVRARKTGGLLLVLTRKALDAMELNVATAIRTRIATRFVHEARDLLNRLRALDISRDRGFDKITARVRERLAQIRALIPVMHDSLAGLQLIEVELLVLSGDLTSAHARLEALMLSIRTIQGRDLRDEVAVRYLDLCSAPRGRVSPVEGGSTQRVVDCSGS